MKKFLNITLVLFAALLVFSCRNDSTDIPEDIHDHDEIEKMVVRLTNANDPTDVQTINYIGGVADGHIHAHAGDVFNVELDFQVKHDNHYDSVNGEIIQEKDEHFITFGFSGANVTVKRAANDVARTDGNKLGLKTQWTVVSTTPTGKVNIKLVHAPTSVNQNSPSADNQLGSTTGGESDVDALIDLH
ncbi:MULTISPECIES: hypothetical protein [Chryseobacterium]|uniref:Lipoprotein n=1 Tax=Chryseobacterium taihuense TaxID=1141221 RepID=A0A4U8WD18_9FLAO|nr:MULTISPECIES: hypothetical protein [Chryseobacterium]QQV03501.1 hypothetical protein I6I61_03925 [Chryseobacterium sp. FDAARGOS 1104]VFB03170.1 Uncharacterised protein [Chryseobacterium taihuense]